MGTDKLDFKFIVYPMRDKKDNLTDVSQYYISCFETMFEPQVIFNNETTIFKYCGQLYKATAKNEPFDEEKGVLICAMKAQYQIKNYTHLRKLIDNAKRYGTAKKDNK